MAQVGFQIKDLSSISDWFLGQIEPFDWLDGAWMEHQFENHSQLSVVAYSVIQLLLEPHSATLYYENKKIHPPNLQQVQIKYGLIEGMILNDFIG